MKLSSILVAHGILLIAPSVNVNWSAPPATQAGRPATSVASASDVATTTPATTAPSEADLVKRGILRITQRQKLQVRHVTTVNVPQVALVRVMHGLPVPALWSIKSAENGLDKFTAEPTVPAIKFNKEYDGNYFEWELRDPAPGSMKFVTSYQLMTATREFLPGALKLTWSDFDSARLDKGDPEISIATDEMVKLVEAARKKPKPLTVIPDFTKWIGEKIVYDEKVGHSPLDVKSTLQAGRGHCGHRARVFMLLCKMAGIEARQAFGFFISKREGLWDGRSDWNRHTWAEVNVPGIGWIEVEPAIPLKGKTPFYIPATYIQNRYVQSARVVCGDEDGRYTQHEDFGDTVELKQVK